MHKDDKKWITEQMLKLEHPMLRQQALVKYKEVYKQAHDAEPLIHRKDGKARSTANNRLRIYIKRITNG